MGNATKVAQAELVDWPRGSLRNLTGGRTLKTSWRKYHCYCGIRNSPPVRTSGWFPFLDAHVYILRFSRGISSRWPADKRKTAMKVSQATLLLGGAVLGARASLLDDIVDALESAVECGACKGVVIPVVQTLAHLGNKDFSNTFAEVCKIVGVRGSFIACHDEK